MTAKANTSNFPAPFESDRLDFSLTCIGIDLDFLVQSISQGFGSNVKDNWKR
jgi:hypothetical protein